MKCSACDFEYTSTEAYNTHWAKAHDGQAVTPTTELPDFRAPPPLSEAARKILGGGSRADMIDAATKPARKPRSDKGKPRQKPVAPPVEGKKTRRSRAKPNITPSDVGGLYLSPKGEVYRLKLVEAEPRVEMTAVGEDEEQDRQGGISMFKDFVKLVPKRRK